MAVVLYWEMRTTVLDWTYRRDRSPSRVGLRGLGQFIRREATELDLATLDAMVL